MELFTDAAAWVAQNETLLSGLAALVVVVGVVFTPLGVGARRLLQSNRDPDEAVTVSKGGARPEPAGTTSADTRPSIAVIPFANMSDDPQQEFLADGMTEDIITALSANRSLRVIARNSVFAYKGRSPDIREVGRELHVRYVLEGSLRRIGERLRTTAQLIEAETGGHVWAEKYDRIHAEMSESQDEVVRNITGALTAQLMSAEQRRALRGSPADLDSWALVQRGISRSIAGGSGSSECNLESLADTRAAVELDPQSAYAHSALAWMLLVGAVNGFVEDFGSALREAQEHLRIGMQGATDDPQTLYYCGAAYLYSGQYEQAVRVLRNALDLDPHQSDAMMQLGLALGYLGRFAEAHEAFDRAEVIAPTGGSSPIYGWYRGIVFGCEGRYEEAIALIRNFVDHHPRYGSARVTLALDYAAIGQMDEAREMIECAHREDPGIFVDGMALMVGAHPDREAGQQRVAMLRTLWPRD